MRGIFLRGRSRCLLLLAPALLSAVFPGAPALAKEKPTATFQASADFRTAAVRAQQSLAANDLAGAGGAISALTPASPLERYMAASLRLELAARRGDTREQRKAVNDIIASGAMPAEEEGRLRYMAGFAALQSGANEEALSQLARAHALGQNAPEQSLLLAEAYLRRKREGEALPLVDAAIEAQGRAGRMVPASWYDRAAALAFAQKNWPVMARYHAARLVLPASVAADWRSATASYVAGARPDKEAELDLLRLQNAAGALASERDVQAYAALASAQGYPAEAKSVIEAGRKNGELAAADPVSKGLLAAVTPKAVTYLAALKSLPGKAGSAASGTAAAASADKLLANAQYAEAVPYYRAALAKGGIDADRANARLGIALARSGDMAGAQAAFAQAKGQWGDVARYWSAWAATRK